MNRTISLPPCEGHPDRREDGFVLIAAIWLLILAGAFVALMMLRGIADDTTASRQAEAAQDRLAARSAIEAVMADRLFNGTRSRWWLVPVRGGVNIGDNRVEVVLSSEAGRLDLNEADLPMVDGALRGLGVAAAGRNLVLSRLQALRAAKKSIGSFAEMRALTAVAGPGAGCLDEELTFASGLAAPEPGQMSPRLAAALALPGGAAAPAPLSPGAAARIAVRTDGGATATAIVRIAPSPDQILAVSGWLPSAVCPG